MSHVFIMLILENMKKKFLSETIRSRALIFGVKHSLVDLYQFCSNYAHRTKNGPAAGVTCFTLTYIVKNMEHSSCLKPYGLEP